MAVFKLSPEQVSAEIAEMPLLSMPGQAVQERQDYVRSLAEQANGLPGGHVKKIVWDEADGYPRHAWGYVQYTVRPYVPGYGCDGTTDRNIHLIAKRLCAEVGVDYREAYRAAYGKEEPESDNPVWIDRLDDDAALASETIVPEVSRDSLVVMLRDLYQVNNRSLVAELAERLTAVGRDMRDWWRVEDEAKARLQSQVLPRRDGGSARAAAGPTM